MRELIEKQTAIDAINSHFGFNIEEEYGSAVQEVINGLPPAKPKWIPCSERMPENEATVLVTVAPPGIELKVLEMSYSNGHWYRNDMLISPWWVVVAWRPMPKPYFKGVLCGEAFEEENESRIP